MVAETNWLIQDQPYSFKEYQKLYGKSVNRAIRKDLRFVRYEEWENDISNSIKGYSEEDCIRRQIDFEFKEAYNYLIKTIDKTDSNFEVNVCSRIDKEGADGRWIFRNYKIFLQIKNKEMDNQIYLDDVSSIYKLCFQMTSKDFFEKLAMRLDKKSFYKFLYVKKSTYEELL